VSIHRHRIYLDHNATSPLVEPARIAMAAALDAGGNPSSVHREGRRARHVVETARDQVAALLGVARDDVVLTSGGTEADRLGLAALAGAGAGPPARIARPPIEHPAVLGAAGPDALALEVDAAGRVDLAGVDRALAAGARVIAVAAVNHELGTVQDLAAIAARVRAAGARLFVDAVQAAGKLALAPITALADAVAISAHKLGGPTGVGAVWVRPGLDAAWPTAGHQEHGRRGGTENVAGIAGFGAAAAAVLAADARPWAEVAALGEVLEAGLIGQGARIHGAGAPRVGGTVNAGWDGVLGESLVIGLDLAGVAASTGAACTSGTIAPSPVLLALGLPAAEARRAVRFSLGRTTTRDEVDRVLAILPGLVDTARRARA
jgi:cysteine desulfurase